MKSVQIKVVAPAVFGISIPFSHTKLGVFLDGSMIGIYLVHIDDDSSGLSFLDLRGLSPETRLIQGCLRGYAYGAHSMGEQIAADLAQMGYECEGNWIADSVYDHCLYCSGYSEHLGNDWKRCADRKCILLRVE